MLPVVDRPAIHWVVAEAVASGVTDILIVTGREKRAIEDYFDASPKWDAVRKDAPTDQAYKDLEALTSKAHFHFVRQKEPRGLGDAILQAEKHVGGEPFLVILGDTINVADPPVAKQLWDVYGKWGHPVIAVEEVRQEKISDYGIVAPGKAVDDRTFEVADLVEKPSPAEAPSSRGEGASWAAICATVSWPRTTRWSPSTTSSPARATPSRRSRSIRTSRSSGKPSRKRCGFPARSISSSTSRPRRAPSTTRSSASRR